jgi:outer membrane protein assembly factor BamD (BamD/ComL family)
MPVVRWCLLLIFCLTAVYAGAAGVSLTDIQSAFLQKDYTKTKELVESFVTQPVESKEKIEALYYAGLSDLWLGQYLQARKTIQRALDAKPDRPMQEKANLALIDTYYMEGDYRQALSRAEDLLTRTSRPESLSPIYLKLARSHLKLAHWKKGREYLQKIIDEFPNSPERYQVDQLLQESQFFAVQVGSFQDRDKAEASVEDLQKKGEYAYVVETASEDGKKFYRVRVGKFKLFGDAKKLEAKLHKLGYPTKIYP